MDSLRKMPGSATGPIRIAILDGHTLVRAGLRLLIERQPGMEVVGEAGNLSEGLGLLASSKPEIGLIDLNLPCESTADIIPSLVKANEKTRLILVTGSTNPQLHQQAVEEGVVGVVYKTQPPEILYKAIEKVYAGEVWLERSMIASVLSRLSRNPKNANLRLEMDSIIQLSEREKQIIKLIGEGYKNKRISTQLCISETTVRHHLTSIYGKLGVSDRLELLVFAHRYGLVRPPNSQ